jgi:FtsH-binding integral membrane protein
VHTGRMQVSRVGSLLALAGGLIAALMAWAYVGVMRSQGDTPLAWVLVVLGLGVVLAAYGAMGRMPYRRPALFVGGALLVALGVLAILSIGLPILLAGVLLIAAGAFAARPTVTQPR